MQKLFYLTDQGIANLQTQLLELAGLRQTAIRTIQMARELGNLDENAEYISAKQNLDKLETRILEIEGIIENARPIQHSKSAKIGLGSTVTLRLADGIEKQVQVVSTIEADPLDNKISDESPLGQTLLNKTHGDVVEIRTTTYTIVNIG